MLATSLPFSIVRLNLSSEPLETPSVVTIGNFDGVHRGHQAVLAALKASAERYNLPATVVSFYPHPSVVLAKAQHMPLLTSLRKKIELLAAAGISRLALIHFTKDFSQTAPDVFLERIFIRVLKAKAVVLGHDTRLGKGRLADTAYIHEWLAARGVSSEIGPVLNHQGVLVSSGMLRKELTAGHFMIAEQFLGRKYSLVGRVIHGDGRGRKLGTPTANLAVTDQALPPLGVYACRARTFGAHAGEYHHAVLNVGVRPTFGPGSLQVEAHILDGNHDLYGKVVEVELWERIRGEQRFGSVEQLKTQIALDIQAARHILDNPKA